MHKSTPIALIALIALAALAVGQAQPPTTGGDTPGVPEGDSHVEGVKDDTCWVNSSGNTVHVGITGGLFGQKVTFTEGTNSDTVVGTQNLAGGCQSSAVGTLGSDSFRIHDNKMQYEGPNGWVNMTEVECDDDDGDGGDGDGE